MTFTDMMTIMTMMTMTVRLSVRLSNVRLSVTRHDDTNDNDDNDCSFVCSSFERPFVRFFLLLRQSPRKFFPLFSLPPPTPSLSSHPPPSPSPSTPPTASQFRDSPNMPGLPQSFLVFPVLHASSP